MLHRRQAFADKVAVSFDGVERIDRKVVVRLGDVSRPPGGTGISGATDASWVVAVAGDIRQTWGVMAMPNSQCAVWFVSSLGEVFASQRGALAVCDPYFAAR